MKPAVFLDRDGTIIEQVHHLSKVEDVAVYPFAREALQRFHRLGYQCVVVTNQSAVGRGLLNEHELAVIHDEMRKQLGAEAELIRGIYYSTAVPVSGDPRIIEQHDRKPGPGMLMQAAQDLNLDLAASWMIGDAISDILAGRNAGCRGTILVRTGYGTRTEFEHVGTKLQVAGCTLQVGEETKESPQLSNGASPQPVSCPAIDYIADTLLAAAQLVGEHDSQ
ncbi:MAG: HAD family hydrolase [Fuerstiella sp.]